MKVCHEHSCSLCPATNPDVPSDCPVKILHLLAVRRFGGDLRYAARRSGKTTEIIMEARKAARNVGKAVIVVANAQQERHLKDILRAEAPHEEIEAISIKTPDDKLHGKRAKVVLVDEIEPKDEWEAKEMAYMMEAIYAGGLTTPL
jgi:thymidine kinase